MKIKFLLEGFFEDFDQNMKTFIVPKIDRFISTTSLIKEIYGLDGTPILPKEEEERLWKIVQHSLNNHDMVEEYLQDIKRWKDVIRREGSGFERLHAELRSLELFLNQADSYNRAVLRKLVSKGFVDQETIDSVLRENP